jgi:hypothetical protein
MEDDMNNNKWSDAATYCSMRLDYAKKAAQCYLKKS